MISVDQIPEDLRVTVTDIRRLYCVSGARQWSKIYGYDFKDFIENGLPARQFYQHGDLYSRKVVEDIMKRKGLI